MQLFARHQISNYVIVLNKLAYRGVGLGFRTAIFMIAYSSKLESDEEGVGERARKKGGTLSTLLYASQRYFGLVLVVITFVFFPTSD